MAWLGERLTYRRALGLLCLAGVADFTLTVVGVTYYGATEGNPLAAWAMARLGTVAGLVALSLVALAVITAATYWLAQRATERYATAAVLVATTIKGSAAGWNALVLLS